MRWIQEVCLGRCKFEKPSRDKKQAIDVWLRREVRRKHIKFSIISVIQGLANCDLWAKSSYSLSFVNKDLLEHDQVFYLHITCGCFHSATIRVATETACPPSPVSSLTWSLFVSELRHCSSLPKISLGLAPSHHHLLTKALSDHPLCSCS